MSSQSSTSSVMSGVTAEQPVQEVAKPLAKEDKGMETPAVEEQPSKEGAAQ